MKENKNYIIFNGETYLSTNIKQTQLIQENNQFTIAASVYINKYVQSKITSMDILGRHSTGVGFVWQFYTNTNILDIYSSGVSISIDYSDYYEKWTDIVMSYNNGKISVYLDGKLLEEKDNMTLNPSDYNIFIGNGYSNSRTMIGAIKSVKIWNKELLQEEVKNIDYNIKNTNVASENIIQEINFDSLEEIQTVGEIIGEKYNLVSKEKNIECDIKFAGGTYIDINLPEDTILQNSEFTIASRVKISKRDRDKLPIMGILGNHTSNSGIVWQFLNGTDILEFGIGTNGKLLDVDYSEYYDKYVDIVMIYKNNKLSIYFDGVKKNEDDDITLISKENIYIGCSYSLTDRGLYGFLPYVKIWNKALVEQEVKDLNMTEKTTIQTNNILKELNLTTLENINECGKLTGNKFEMILVGK